MSNVTFKLEEHAPLMLSLKDTSVRSGIPYDTLRRMCLDGKIVHIRVGKKIYINWDLLRAYLYGGAE